MVKAVSRRTNGKGSPKYLELLASIAVTKGLEGDVSAIKEIGDRLDGKPVQGVELAMDVRITAIERRIVDPIEVIEVEAVSVALEAPLLALAVPGEGEGEEPGERGSSRRPAPRRN